MNNEKGVDLNTDFQRSFLVISVTDEASSLLKNIESNKFHFSETKIIEEGFINFHLHLLYPQRDTHKGELNTSVKGKWSIEYPEWPNLKNEPIIGTRLKPVIFDPEIHSSACIRILASTANLMGTNSNFQNDDLIKYKWRDKTNKKDVYNICNSLIEEYVSMQGQLEYVMIQPFYSYHQNFYADGRPYTSVEYKKDLDGFIAVFPALAYNRAELENQIY